MTGSYVDAAVERVGSYSWSRLIPSRWLVVACVHERDIRYRGHRMVR